MDPKTLKIDLLVHDLKTPLAIIDAGVKSLLKNPEKYGPISKKQEKVLNRVYRNSRLTQRLVADILELGKSREGKINLDYVTPESLIRQALIEIFDLHNSGVSDDIKQCGSLKDLETVLDSADIAIESDESVWLRSFLLDEAKMLQIIRNLISNALKYKKTSVKIRCVQTDESLSLSVRDDGEGIPLKNQQQIFECYFQMDPRPDSIVRGHGLGLAGAMILANDMGGALSLESDTGKGAEFTITMPIKSC